MLLPAIRVPSHASFNILPMMILNLDSGIAVNSLRSPPPASAVFLLPRPPLMQSGDRVPQAVRSCDTDVFSIFDDGAVAAVPPIDELPLMSDRMLRLLAAARRLDPRLCNLTKDSLLLDSVDDTTPFPPTWHFDRVHRGGDV